jgi:hypothetical protein
MTRRNHQDHRHDFLGKIDKVQLLVVTTEPDSIHLIVGACLVQRLEASKGLAHELGIQFHLIPPGWTDEPQPLDGEVTCGSIGILRNDISDLRRKIPDFSASD